MSYRKESTFGLDIGNRSLKALQFSARKKNMLLQGFAELALPAGLIEGGEILKPKELSLYIKKVVNNAGIPAKYAITALPESKTFLKLLQIPIQGTLPLKQRLENELQKHLPYGLTQIWWDYALIKKEPTKFLILAGAASKKLVTSYTQLLNQAGLTAAALDIEPLSIARALIKSKNPPVCTLLVDLGATKSTLITANPVTVFFTADGRSSSNKLTETLTKNLKIDINAAEEMKCKNGLKSGTPQYLTIVQDYTAKLAQRIKETISFSGTSEHSCPAIAEILLTGGGALLKGLPESLSNTLKIPVRLSNPWINTGKNTISSKIGPEMSLRFATACGLALTASEYDHTS